MRITIQQLAAMKAKGERFSMLTAYDYSTAKLVEQAGVPVILVGDSLGMVILGYDSAIPVTLEDMIHHTKAVVRGTEKALIVADLPFMTYHTAEADALRSVARVIQEGGAQAVKLEGGISMAPTVARVVQCGVPVMGHIGLTPQSANQLGGFRVQGRDLEAAMRLLDDAKALEEAGAFAIVLECIPAPLTKLITERSGVPTIGIGAGVHCDGQVQVVSDLLGMFTDFVPRHAKQYAKLGEATLAAVAEYVADVGAGSFPTPKHAFTMDDEVLRQLTEGLVE